MAAEPSETEEVNLGLFEKYLTLWITICIIVGLLLGRFLPQFGQYLDSLKFGQISIPIGICLFLMMYPTVVGISFSDVKKATSFPKPMVKNRSPLAYVGFEAIANAKTNRSYKHILRRPYDESLHKERLVGRDSRERTLSDTDLFTSELTTNKPFVEHELRWNSCL